jgi:hypothetical protein
MNGDGKLSALVRLPNDLAASPRVLHVAKNTGGRGFVRANEGLGSTFETQRSAQDVDVIPGGNCSRAMVSKNQTTSRFLDNQKYA